MGRPALADRMRPAKADGSAERNWGIAALADLLDSYPVITAAVHYLDSMHSGHYNDTLQGLFAQRPLSSMLVPNFQYSRFVEFRCIAHASEDRARPVILAERTVKLDDPPILHY